MNLRQRYHPVVWWVFVLHAAFGLCFILLTPTYRGPDETEHVDMAHRFPDGPLIPDPTTHLNLTSGVVATIGLMGPSERPRPPQVEAEAVPRRDRPSYADLDIVEGSDLRNQMTQHPPLYYLTQSTVRAGIDAVRGTPMSWDSEVLVYRLVSWLATLALPLLAAEGALALRMGKGASAVTAAVTLCVPMATWVGILVNNDSFVITAASVAVVGALGYACRGGWGYAAMAAVGCAIAPWAKSTGAPIVAWVGVVVAVSAVLVTERRRIGPLALMVVGAIVGGSWHLSNLIRYADPQPNGFGPGNPETGADTSVLAFFPEFATRVNPSFWGEPGRKTGVTLPDWAFWILALSAIAMILVAVVNARPRLPLLALAGLVAATLILLYRITYRGHIGSGSYPALQGRYVFPLLVPIALLVTAGVLSILRRLARSTDDDTGGAFGGWLAAVGVGLHVFLAYSMLTGGYWDAAGDGLHGLYSSVVAWSAVPPAATTTTFVATGLIVIAAAAFGAVATGRARTGARPQAAAGTRTTS